MNLKNKKVLITAGPVCVKIDSVRVISNTATGQTGILLAKELERLGARVTLLLGPVEMPFGKLSPKIRLLRFKFFDQLEAVIKKMLKNSSLDAVLHSAAVSDYGPKKVLRRKLSSEKSSWSLELRRMPKIIESIKKKRPDLLLVGFKFEPEEQKSVLLKKAQKLLEQAKLDLVVANTIGKSGYRAYIVNSRRETEGPIFKKEILCKRLVRAIAN